MFEDKVIRTDSLENIVDAGAVTGFRFALRLASDRGMWLSLLGGFYVSVDGGDPYPQSALTLHLGNRSYPVEALASHPEERWGAFQEGWLSVDTPGGLTAGEHTIDFQMVLLGGYFKARESWVENPPKPGEAGEIHRFHCTLREGRCNPS